MKKNQEKRIREKHDLNNLRFIGGDFVCFFTLLSMHWQKIMLR